MIRYLFLLASFNLLAVAAAPAQEPDYSRDLRGYWFHVDPGSVPRPPDPASGFVFTEITADKFVNRRMTRAKGKVKHDQDPWATYKIDPAQRHIDFTLLKGPMKGKTLRGIYNFENGLVGPLLTVCFAAKPEGARPNSYRISDDVRLLHFAPAKKDMPQRVAEYWDELEREAKRPFNAIELPVAEKYLPIDAKNTNVAAFGLTREGHLEVLGRTEPLRTHAEIRAQFDKEAAARKQKAGPGPLTTDLVLFADRNCHMKDLYDVARLGLGSGFPRVFLQVEANALRNPTRVEGRLELDLANWRRPEQFSTHKLYVRTFHDGINNGHLNFPMELLSDKKRDIVSSLREIQSELRARRVVCVNMHFDDTLRVLSLVSVLDNCRQAGCQHVLLNKPPRDINVDAPETMPRPAKAPDAATLARAEKEVDTIFASLRRTAKPEELERSLLLSAELCDEPAARFVLLRQGANAASRAGHYEVSMTTLDRLADDYAFDVWNWKLEQFKDAPVTVEVVDTALRQARNAVLHEQRPVAARLFKIGAAGAKQLKQPDLLNYVEDTREIFRREKVVGIDEPLVPASKDKPPAPTPAQRDPGNKPATAPPQASSDPFVWYLLGGGLVALGLLAALVLWLRRGDQAVRARLSQARPESLNLPEDQPPECTT